MNAPAIQQITAELNQSRNDLHWKVWAGDDKFIRWAGYDDDYWWDNISPKDDFRARKGPITGRIFTLDPQSNEVSITPAQVLA